MLELDERHRLTDINAYLAHIVVAAWVAVVVDDSLDTPQSHQGHIVAVGMEYPASDNDIHWSYRKNATRQRLRLQAQRITLQRLSVSLEKAKDKTGILISICVFMERLSGVAVTRMNGD